MPMRQDRAVDGFRLAYERTGRIGTTVVAHCLFNLNTIAMVLLGLGNS